jgi:hypothetical protein
MAEPFTLTPLPATPPERDRRPRGLLIAAVVLLLLGIGAAIAKHSSTSKTSSSVILAASSKTKAAGSSKFTADIQINSGGQSLSFTMDGVVDSIKKLASITINTAGTQTEIRTIDGIEYFHSELATLPDGKQWVQIDPKALGINTAAADAAGSSDPMSELELLGGLKGDPTVVGHEQLDGVPVTHYSMTIDFTAILDKLAQGSKALGSDTLLKGLDQLRKITDLSHIPAEAWLDDNGLVREFKFSMHISVSGNTVDEVATMRFSDFGTPVTVEAPPADQVVSFNDVPDVFKQLTAN